MKLLHSLLTPTDRKDRTTQRHQMPQGMESHGTYDSAGIHLPIVKTKNSKRYLHMAVAMLMGTVSTGALAIDCPSGYQPVTVADTDYMQLQKGAGGNINIKGPNQSLANLGLKLNIDMTTFGSKPYVQGLNATSAFTIYQRLDNQSETNIVNFTFNKPITNLSFNLYDIDYAYNNYQDKITITGEDASGSPVPLQFSNATGKRMVTNNNSGIVESKGTWDGGISCDNFLEFLSSKCSATVTFDSPIKKFTLEYANLTGPNTQNIELQFNEFCAPTTETPPPPTDPTPTNPGTCPAGWVSDEFAASDYQNLVSSNNITYINGTKNESYLNARMQKSQTNLTNFSLTANNYFWIDQKISSNSGKSVFTYEFTNKFTGEKQELKYLELNIGDIDYVDSFTAGSKYQDQVKIIGYAGENNTPIYPTMMYQGTNVEGSTPTYYSKQTAGCDNSNAYTTGGDKCRLRLKFNEAIDRLQITYDNHSNIPWNRRTNQQLAIKFENYCYKPQPRLSFSKVLSGDRIKDTDQFTVKVTKQGSDHAAHSTLKTTTQGEGNTIDTDTGTTGVFKVVPDTTYTLKEEAAGSTDLSNYTVTYQCTNKDGSEIESPNPLNPKAFEMTYGQEWTCTVTNTPLRYNFSGTVFNDNGGINDVSEADPTALGGVYNNDKYFNGQLDDGEKGIYESGLKVSLTDCDNNNIIRTVDVSSSGSNIGKYAISLPKSELNGATQVCLVEHTGDDLNENLQTYSIDTSPNSITIPLNTNPEQLEYPNKNFGNVIEKNTALVLVKRQYFHDCNKSMPEIQSAEVDPIGGPTAGFSKDTIKNDQGEASSIGIKQCISYRIDAYNRGFVDLTQVVIKDTLPDRSILTTPLPHSPDSITFSDSSVAENQNGQVITNPFTLPKRTNNLTRKAIFFNTNFNN